MIPLQRPILAIFNTRPSWLNSNGRIDRSACCEITIGQLRRYAGCVRFRAPRPGHKQVKLPPHPLLDERPARNRHGRIASGVYRVTANDLLAALARRPPRLIPQHRPVINQLHARYGLLFQPRTLLCPRCLGVRYGNNQENARQSWRRLAGKPDARPAKRIVKKSNNRKWAQETKRKTRRRKR